MAYLIGQWTLDSKAPMQSMSKELFGNLLAHGDSYVGIIIQDPLKVDRVIYSH